MPNPLNVPITPPRVAFIDPRTGNVSREWYMFFLSLYQLTGGSDISLDDVQKGPPTVTIDEINSIIDKTTANLGPSQDELLAQIAELQKQINGLEAGAALPQLGTMAPMNKEFMDFIGFNQNAGVVVQPGQMAWNSGDGTLDIGMGYDGVVQQVGLETYYRIKAGSTIADGDLIMFAGAVGASGVIIGVPTSTGLTEGLQVMGVATMNIATNDFGYVTAFGLVRGINTTGASVGETWADGDILYYNPSYTGRMTNVRPTSPNEVVVVAAVVNAGPGGSGSLFVRTSFYPKLAELSDVYAPTPANGKTLIYDATTGRWEGATLTAGTNVTITNGPGSITIASTNPGGTVTSVGLSLPSEFSVSGSPVTSSGTLSATWANESANTVFAAPNGSTGTPSFRVLVAADIPALPYVPTGAPVTKTADFTVAASEGWLINNKSGSTCTVTLPAAASYTGRELKFQNYQNQLLVSASSNVVPLGGGSAGTAILDAVAGNWATLVSDGTNWIIMQGAANNCLLIE